MSTDIQFVASGPADAGFKTTGTTLNLGAILQGVTQGAAISASAQALSVAAVTASSPFGSASLAANINDDSTLPDQPVGAYGESLGAGGTGVRGKGGAAGVFGENADSSAVGLLGGRDRLNHQLVGAYGESDQQGVYGLGLGSNGTGVYGVGKFGVRGETGDGIGVKGAAQGAGVGVWGQSQSGEAGHFAGKVTVDGPLEVNGHVAHHADITVDGDVFLRNRDLAERFCLETATAIDPGTVMVIGRSGAAVPSSRAYDKRVVGVVAGAGTLRPAITLGDELLGAGSPTAAISMVGTAFCRVDATHAPVEVGDMLTTSDTPGHAMKATDPARACGAIIGKALGSMNKGLGLVPMLVTLQ